ncbi:MAG: DMT family transporter [Pseudomonadota bacterium]
MATRSSTASDRPLQGIVLMSVAMLLLPGIDAIAKLLAERVPVVQIVWARFAFQSLFFALALALWGQVGSARPIQLSRQLARGALIALATVLFFSALPHLPLADAIALFFVEPLLLTLLAAVLLGEAIGWRRLAAVAVGFGSALLIIQPSFARVGSAALLPVAAAAAFAFYLILTRSLSAVVSPLAMQFYAGVAGVTVMTVVLVLGAFGSVADWQPVWPAWTDWLWLALLGAIASVGHFMVVLAFARAPAATLAPFQYLEIITATVLGYSVFGDLPSGLAVVGMIGVIGSGLFIAWREHRLARTTQGES